MRVETDPCNKSAATNDEGKGGPVDGVRELIIRLVPIFVHYTNKCLD